MNAIQIHAYGGPEVLTLAENIAKPTPGGGQVLIDVHAASINPIDWKVRAGYLKDMMPLTFPVTLGGDVAGVVVAIGAGVTAMAVGDAVYGQAGFLNGGSGAFAEFAAARVTTIAPKPAKANFQQAAALPLVGVSALQAIDELIALKAGQKILIHGGIGGIGHIAIQRAKALGAFVATTANVEDSDTVKALGASQVIDYKKQAFEEVLHDFDAVFDTVGGDTTERSFKVLKKGGVLVSMLGAPSADLAKQYGVKAIGQSTQVTRARLERLAVSVDAGEIQVHIDSVFPLVQARDAFVRLEAEHQHGKVVLQVTS